MRRTRRPTVPGVVGVAFAVLVTAGLVWHLRREAAEHPRPASPRPPTLTPLPLPPERVAVPPASGVGAAADPSTRPPTSKGPPRGPTVAGPCGGHEPVVRPSIVVPWNLRVEELINRAMGNIASANANPITVDRLTPHLAAALGPGGDEEDVLAMIDLPNRVPDGFDYAVATALTLAGRAWTAEDFETALARAELARRLDPEDDLPPLVMALCLEALGRPADALRAFEDAHALRPDEAAVALAVGRRLALGPRQEDAADALETYLAVIAPDEDPGIDTLARRVRARAAHFADAVPRDLDGLTLLVAPGALGDAGAVRPLHLDIARALAEAAWLTGTERRERLTVLVHRTRADLRAGTCSPGWTDALYDGALHLHGEALQDPRRREASVRHEVLHAQIHAVPLPIPKWLDEGLAQYFAASVPGTQVRARARGSWRTMVRHQTWVPFASLEDSFLVIEAPEDAGLAYHQSLAMVDWLVARRGRGVIAEAIADLQEGGDPRTIPTRIGGEGFTGRAVLAHLADVLGDEPGSP